MIKSSAFRVVGLLSVGLLVGCKETSQSETQRNSSSDKLLRSQYEPQELERLCNETLDRAQKSLDAIVQESSVQSSGDALLRFENILAEFSESINNLTFMKYVSTEEKLRAVASECESKEGQFSVSVFTRRDLYEALSRAKPQDSEETRLLSETLKAFEKNGLKLPEDQLAAVKKLMTELTIKETDFSKNINDDKSQMELTAEELKGVPESVLGRFEKTPAGKYIVTMKGPDYVPVIENATSGETRKKVQTLYQNRAAEKNIPLLKEIIHLRQEVAKRMGYKTWADYQTSSGRMAKNAQEVMSFLNGLKQKLSSRAQADLAQLRKMKEDQEPGSKAFYEWDRSYYSYQLKKVRYSLDDEKIREYFPADTVVKGMFKVYSRLLGVRFEEVSDAAVWAPDVKLYRILDEKTQATVAYFYTDFFPREGKYSHAAAFNLISGRRLPDGSYQKPVSSIVANFTPPSEGRPSLLSHDEVETVFHEFGHIMHQTLTKAPYASLSGTAVARDFVEAPSQMLENWVWSSEVLASLSGHYKNPENKLPEQLLKSMIEARDYNQGLFYTRQLYYGLLDMTYHTLPGSFDTTQIARRLHKEITGLDPVPNSHWEASFGHLMGYSAGYYGYLWSEVYAEDMFTRFEKEGLLNPEVGLSYRGTILESGNMRDAVDLVTEFLGRTPSRDAFFKRLHIAP